MTSLLVWPIAVPLAGSLLAVAWPRRAPALALGAALLTTAASLGVLGHVARYGQAAHAPGGWGADLGIELQADGLSAVFLAMTALVALAITVYARSYFDAASPTGGRFWALWLALWSALSVLLLSADLFNIYVGLELLGLAAVSLTALDAGRTAVEAALRYLIAGMLGSLAYLLGVALLYATYGSLDLATLAARVEPEPAAWAALVLMTTGLMFKAALLPMHFWLPAAHANAPAPVSAALSALVVKVAVYLILRLWLDLFAPILTASAAWWLGGLGAAAVLWGSWQALRAERLKQMAAYSTVSQIGYLVLILALLVTSPPGEAREDLLGALVLLALTHGFAKAGLFLAAGRIQARMGHDRISGLAGAAQDLPVTVAAVGLAGVALVGLPPSGTFTAKWMLLAEAFRGGHWWVVLTVVAGTLLAGGYLFRVLGHAFGMDAPRGARASNAHGVEMLPLALAAAATLVLGLAAAPLWGLLEGAPVTVPWSDAAP
jgi:formate hydrogenlyase subunit 3/multisubunit Na+/H+ antiporter MnhD subunit